MKKRSLILALFLCLVALGGLTVLLRERKDSTPSKDNSSNGSIFSDEIKGISLNETNLIF